MQPAERLKRRADFLALDRAGRVFVRPCLVVRVRPRPERPHTPSRVGFTASRRVGGAVQRNFAKRRLRELARLSLVPLMRERRGFWAETCDMVLIARRGIVACSWAELLQQMETVVRRLNAASPGHPDRSGHSGENSSRARPSFSARVSRSGFRHPTTGARSGARPGGPRRGR